MEVKIAKALAKEVGGASETECLDGLERAFADARMNLYLVDYFCSEFSDVFIVYITHPRANICINWSPKIHIGDEFQG